MTTIEKSAASNGSVNKASRRLIKRKSSQRLRLLVVGFTAQLVLSGVAAAQSPQPARTPPLMDREKEIALALSSCPPSIADKAGVYVLDKSGYVKVRDSQNGFTAIVQHPSPTGQAPQCMDSEGARTFLPRILKVAELRALGKSREEIQKFDADAIASGVFPTPQHPGVIYMLSTQNIQPTFPPHVMFYGTHLTNGDLGVNSTDLGSDGNPKGPTFVAGEGPFSLLIVPVGPHGLPHNNH